MSKPKSDIEASYDLIADEFAAEFLNELDRKPFDRNLLDEFAALVGGRRRVCELGCGPGQIARYLKDRGLDMCGIDLSAEMVKRAAGLNPDISFRRGDMVALDTPGNSYTGIICFYAIIHLPREQVASALSEMNRVLEPGGHLLLSFHGGKGEIRREEWYEHKVAIFATLFEPDEMGGYLQAAGFEVERVVEREPYDFEYSTRRVYALARKPSEAAR